jgi:hypothetical protein
MKFALAVLFALIVSATASAQSRDYLTDQEIEVVRDAQQIDDRIDVLVHMIERRLTVLGAAPASAKKEKPDVWGPPPTGTRIQLLNDIKLILQKAVDDIDNLSARPDSMIVEETEEGKKPKGFSDLFPKAVRILAAGAARFEPIFKVELDKSTDAMEKGILLNSIDRCDEIIASVAKLPAEVKKAKH